MATSPPSPGRRPNILFILSDQQRWDTLGCYGQTLPISPNLDRLASEGVLFEHAFTCQPVCGPCRSSLQSGLYPTATGCYINNRALPVDQPTVAKQMRAAGYTTAYIGKWHLAADEEHPYRTTAVPPERRGGFDDYWMGSDVLEFTSHGYEGFVFDRDGNRVDWEGYRVDAMTNFVLDYLRDYASSPTLNDKPFYMFASYIEPHHQNDLDRYIGPIGSKQRFASYPTPGDLAGTKGDWKKHYPDYLGCCWSLDQNVGRIRAQLELLGLWDNTLVIYTSDHGSHFRTRNGEYKRSCHEACLRVPLIMHGPGFAQARPRESSPQARPCSSSSLAGIAAGQKIDQLVSLIDLPATVLSAAGAEALPVMHGRPIQGLIDGSAKDWPREVFAQISESHIGRTVRTARWKYAVGVPLEVMKGTTAPGAERYVETFLYDLPADPHERNNLVADPALATVRGELAATLKRRMVAAGEAEPTIVPAAHEA
ncbi:MAG: sulfatase-like hydrolase/transferase [Phycisphaeraceae bacterium]